MRKCQHGLAQQLGRDPSLAELADATGLTALDIREVLFRAQEPLSLDAQQGASSDLRLVESLACASTNPQEEVATALLRFRYGLTADQPLTLSATARRMGISRDSARGLERRATASIRQLSAGFADYLQA